MFQCMFINVGVWGRRDRSALGSGAVGGGTIGVGVLLRWGRYERIEMRMGIEIRMRWRACMGRPDGSEQEIGACVGAGGQRDGAVAREVGGRADPICIGVGSGSFHGERKVVPFSSM